MLNDYMSVFWREFQKNTCEHACGGNRRGGENVVEKCVPKIVPTKRQKYLEVQDEENW